MTYYSISGIRVGVEFYRSTWVDPPSWFLGLIPLLLKVGAVHGTHYETTNPSLVCTNPTSSGQTAGSNLAVIASVRSSRVGGVGICRRGGSSSSATKDRTEDRASSNREAQDDAWFDEARSERL